VSYAHDIESASRQRKVLDEIDHRPWPLPDEREWIMGQTWENLLFAHWRVPEEALRRVVHPDIPIDTYDGSAWIGVTPFTVTGLHARGTPPPPVVASFHEINVRTYATIDGKPGIYFLSLDAASRAAVATARKAYRLPYFHAAIEAGEEAGAEPMEEAGAEPGGAARPALRATAYRHERRQPDGPPAAFEATYKPTGEKYEAEPGTFDHWATERYCLYTVDEQQRIQRGDIHHPPWPLQPATAAITKNTMAEPYGIDLNTDPILHFARMQDVLFWPLEPQG
jgi:uncharacterized protein